MTQRRSITLIRNIAVLAVFAASFAVPNIHALSAAEMDMHGMEMGEMECDGSVCEPSRDQQSCLEHCLELAALQEGDPAVMQPSEVRDDGVDREWASPVIPRDAKNRIQPSGPAQDPGPRFILQQRE